jgi:hypothetical protein
VSLATIQYQVMGHRGSPPATLGTIASLHEPLIEQICMLHCGHTSRAARGNFTMLQSAPGGLGVGLRWKEP